MTNTRRAFFIDPQSRERPGGPPAALGFTAYNLARMAAIGLPVPHAFVLGTGYCPGEELPEAEGQAELNQVLTAQLRRMERATGLTYGGSRRPLLLSVRSSAPSATAEHRYAVLNVGLNETALRGLLRTTGNPRLAWDSYRRLVQSYALVVDGCDPEPFESLLDEHLLQNKAARPQELDARALSRLAREYLGLYRRLVGKNFPQDTMEQLRAAVHGVFRSWHGNGVKAPRRTHKGSESTAVAVQRMVFGNAGGTSGSGVACTRNPATGEHGLHLEFMFNAQAEDLAAPRDAIVDAAELGLLLPTIERRLTETAHALEAEFKDMQAFDFTVQDEVLYLLESRCRAKDR